MPFDPQKHHRRSIRLPGYDYRSPGAYFFTLNTYDRECLFGQIVDGEMRLSRLGSVVLRCWHSLPRHFASIALDAFVVMPNHVHGIIVTTGTDCSCRGEASGEVSTQVSLAEPFPDASPLQPDHPSGTQPGSLGAILQSLKSVCTRKCNQVRGTPPTPLWQRNYYEHIIRDESELQRTRQYVVENPLHWEEDEDNPETWR